MGLGDTNLSPAAGKDNGAGAGSSSMEAALNRDGEAMEAKWYRGTKGKERNMRKKINQEGPCTRRLHGAMKTLKGQGCQRNEEKRAHSQAAERDWRAVHE